MAVAQTNDLTTRKPLRLWPGVVAAVLLVVIRVIVPLVVPGSGGFAVIGGLVGGLVIIVWWLFFSRAPWLERVGGIALMIVAVFATKLIVHESIANGMMGMMLPVFAIPLLSVALVASAAATGQLSSGPRRALMIASILLACGVFTLVRTGGITGNADPDLHWRWTPTPEQRLLAQQAGDEPAAPAAAPAAVAATTPDKPLPAPAPAEPSAPASAPTAAKTPEKPPVPAAAGTPPIWPGFRGPNRDGVIRGARLETDWSKSPPVELWRRPIGPGWSSFAVSGNCL
jgi:outer membrane protein assembly factor BamB